jgi:WD40 repeat protein
VRVWTRSGRPVESFDSAGGAVAALRFSPDARTLDVVHAGGGIDVRRVRDGTVVARADLRAPVVAIARGASAGELVVATPRSIARVRAGVPARLAEATGVTSLDAHGDLIAAGGTDGTVRLFRGGHVVHVLRGHSGGIVSVAFSADGRRLVTASTDRTAAVWDSASGARLRVLRGHRAALTSARFSPDGRHVVTASKDADARVWVTETGRSSSLLHGHFHFVSDASFSPDGRWILTTGPRTLGLWSAASGALFSPSIEFSPFLRGPSPTITTTLWGPDSQLIVAASSDGTVRRYECALCAPLPRLVALAQARLRATAPRR